MLKRILLIQVFLLVYAAPAAHAVTDVDGSTFSLPTCRDGKRTEGCECLAQIGGNGQKCSTLARRVRVRTVGSADRALRIGASLIAFLTNFLGDVS